MARIKILIGGERVDLVQSSDFPLVLKREQPKDIASRTGDGTYSFTVPNTPNNERVLGSLYRPQNVNNFYKANRLRCDIYDDDQEVLIGGFLTIVSVTKDQYELSVVSPNISWGVLVGGKKLRDLQSLKDIEIVNGQELMDVNAAVDTSDPSQYTHSDTYDFVCPLAFYSPPFVPNLWLVSAKNYISQHQYVASSGGFNSSGEINLPPGKEIYGEDTYLLNSSNTGGNSLFSFKSFPPAAYVRSVIRAIFNDIGYAVAGNILDDVEFKKLCMLYTGERLPQWGWGNLSKARVTSASATTLRYFIANMLPVPTTGGLGVRFGNALGYLGPSATPNIFDYETNNSFALRYSTSVINFQANYVTPTAGRYRFNVQLEGITDSLWNTYLVIFRLPVQTTGSILDNVVTGGTLPNLTFNPDLVLYSEILNTGNAVPIPFTFDSTFELDLLQSEILYVGFIGIFAPPPPAIPVLIDSNATPTSQVVDIQCIDSPTTTRLAANLPDVTQLEFLRWCIRAFNLYLDVDVSTGVAYIDSFTDFYRNPAGAIELKDRCNVYAGKETPNQQAKTSSFQYKDNDTDYLLTRRGGYKRYGTDYVNEVRDANGDEKIEVGFAPTEFDNFQIVDDAADDFLNPVWETKDVVTVPYLTTSDKYFVPQNELITSDQDFQWEPRIVKVKELKQLASGAFLPFRVWDNSIMSGTRDVITQVPEYVRCVFDDTSTPAVPTKVWSLSLNQTVRLGLFRLWIPFLIELQKGHTTEIDVRIDTPLYRLLTLRQLVKLEGGLYRIIKINGFKPLTNSLTGLVFRRVI